MDEDGHTSRHYQSSRTPEAGPSSWRIDSLTTMARGLLQVGGGRLGVGRLHLSISSASQPEIPIISETTPALHDAAAVPAALSVAPPAHRILSPPPLLPQVQGQPPSPATSLGGALAEAEAGISRHVTHQEEMSDLAADAERLRLTSTPISSLDLRSVARAIETALPFMVLMLVVFFYHHFMQIILLAFGTLLLHRANTAIQQQVARKADVQRGRAFKTAVAMTFYASAIGMAGSSGQVYRIMTFRSTAMTQFWMVFFTVALCDLYIRMLLAAAKSLVVSVARASNQSRCRRRGAVLSFLDYLILTYRTMLPTPLWLKYFLNNGLPFPMAMSLAGLYLIAKAVHVLEKASLTGTAAAQLRGGVHGMSPTVEELAAAPRECAICQDDVRTPLRLICGHIFCEDCVEEWLARESSCPMCRREVRRPTLKPRGDGATSLLPLLC